MYEDVTEHIDGGGGAVNKATFFGHQRRVSDRFKLTQTEQSAE